LPVSVRFPEHSFDLTAHRSAATKPKKWADGFYEQFGRRTIDDAIARFIEVRWDMHAHCHDVPDLDLD
jgi:hypothetical protein